MEYLIYQIVNTMKIDQEALRKIAHLARLEVKPEEEVALLNSMDNVLSWMDQLQTTGWFFRKNETDG